MVWPRFLGVSTGRAGSKWIASVFDRAGLPTTHEQHYNASQYVDGRPLPWTRPEFGEWSAQVVPFLEDVPAETVIFHQVRHPLKVVASYMGFHRMLTHPAGHQAEFMARHAGFPKDGPLEDACRLYVTWNRMCHVSDVRWRVEDVTPELIVEASDLAGWPVTENMARLAIGLFPTDMNSRGSDITLTWSDVTEDVRMLGEEYGY